MKKLGFIFSMLLPIVPAVSAQNIYVHVEQEGEWLEQLGTAEFEVNADSQPCVEFVDGKAVMTINGNRVAALPMSSNGTLVVEYQKPEAATTLNKVTKSPSEQFPYVTLYSPFQLRVPSGCETFVPKYENDVDYDVLLLNASTQAIAGSIVPPETALIVSGTEPVDFEFTSLAPTCTLQSGLLGSSLKITAPKESTIYTLGVGKTGPDEGKYGFYRFTGTALNPGLCYFEDNQIGGGGVANAILFNYTTTGINPTYFNGNRTQCTKYIENGRAIIKKGNKKYNINGQEAK